MPSKLPSTHERQKPGYFPPGGGGGGGGVSRDATVVRVLASHLYGPGFIPGLTSKFGLNLLLVLVLGSPVFPSTTEDQRCKISNRPGTH